MPFPSAFPLVSPPCFGSRDQKLVQHWYVSQEGFFSVLYHDRTLRPAQLHRFYRMLLLFRGNKGILNCGRNSCSLSVGAGSPAWRARMACMTVGDPPTSCTVTNISNKLLPHPCSGSCYVFPRFAAQKIPHQRRSMTLCRFMTAHGCAEGTVLVHQINKEGWQDQCLFMWFTWLKDAFQNTFYKNARLFILAGKQWKI